MLRVAKVAKDKWLEVGLALDLGLKIVDLNEYEEQEPKRSQHAKKQGSEVL